MAATLPRPSRPSIGPPTTALPPIPSKKRSIAGVIPTAANLQAAAAAGTPRSGIRAPSALLTPSRTPTTSSKSMPTPKTPSQGSTSALPKLNTISGLNGGGKGLRKTISINAFPQPPSGGAAIRQSSLPTTPMSGNATKQNIHDSSDSSPPRTKNKSTKKIHKSTSTTLNQTYNGISTPSLLNGSGDSRSISSGPGARGSEGLLSLPSPPQSRSSSAQESYSTSATTFEDSGDGMKGHDSMGTDNGASLGPETKGNVLVSVRVRPDPKSDQSRGAPGGDWDVDGRKSLVAFRGKEGGDYYYDNVFATNDNNDKVYDMSAKRLVRRVMDGYHGTVFAYGMTGTGKTFSMQGTDKQPGVIPRAITDIFAYVRETPDREFLLRVSYLEIYNEKIFDLLAGPSQSEDIKLREDSKGRVYAVPLKEEIVQTPTSLLRVISVGDKNRKTSSTQFNARSSRSHAVVQIVVESRLRGSGASENKRSGLVPGGVRVSTLSLIDLAGSERAADSKERRTEGSHINKSLLTLGTVIARLSGDKDKDGKPTDKDGKHLPYRDSKLTRLLQGALSGEALVSILCTVQLGSAGSAAGNTHVNETLNTLKFASRAKNNIVSHAKKHEEPSNAEDGTLLERYRKEIAELKSKLEEANSKKTFDVEDEIEREKEAEIRHEEQLLEMQLARTALKERIDHLQRLVISSKSAGVNSSMSYSSLGTHPRLSSMVSSSHMSQMSARSSLAPSTVGPDRPSVARSASINSHSTLGPRGQRHSGEQTSIEEEESMGDMEGNASVIAQNQALQADLSEKNRYISKLEQRLLQARRSSHPRTSLGFAGSKIMTGEDHAVSSALKEKDAEIADLRSRLDDKDRMLTALRSAARSREAADKHNNMELPLSPAASEAYRRSNQSIRSTLSTADENSTMLPGNRSPTLGDDRMKLRLSSKSRQQSKNAEEMSKILDEMIQDRVESGQITKSVRGSVRVAGERKSPGAALSPMLEEERPELLEMVGLDDPNNVI